jgi:peptidylprolyl isomerase
MPKTTKRAATKRAAKIARAHATDLPKLEVKAPLRPGEKRPARGLARYPWAIGIIVVLILAGLGASWYYHIGPFTLPPKKAVVSPCIASSVVKELTSTAAAPSAEQFAKIQHTYSKAPAMSINTKKLYCVGINTNRGLIVLELDPKIAPNTVNNFVYLAQHHYFDGMKFHRVIPNEIIQTGDPKGDGTGGPGYKFNDEKVQGNYTAGCVAMANSGANTNGSQFFIITGDQGAALDPNYSLFGQAEPGQESVIAALDAAGNADPSANGSVPAGTVTIESVTIEEA